MAAVPLDIEAAGARRRPERAATSCRRCAARSRSRPPPAMVESVELVPGRPAGLPGGGRGDRCGRLGRARPGLVVHQRAAAPARARAARRRCTDHRRARCVTLNLRRSRARPTGFTPSTYLEVLAAHAPDLGSTSCWPISGLVDDRRCWRRRLRRIGRASGRRRACSRRGESRHDARRLAAAYRAIIDDRARRRTTCVRRQPRSRAWQDRPHGDDGPGEGRARRTDVTKSCCRKAEVVVDAAVRRRPAHPGRAHRRRGRARHRRRRAPAAQGHRRDLRPPQRGRRDQRRRAAQGHAVRRPRGQGRRGAGPPDRSARRPRPSRARAAAAGRVRRRLRRGGRVAWRVPRPRLADRAGPFVGARGDLPRPGGRAGPRRRRPPARASRPRPARCAASTAS